MSKAWAASVDKLGNSMHTQAMINGRKGTGYFSLIMYSTYGHPAFNLAAGVLTVCHGPPAHPTACFCAVIPEAAVWGLVTASLLPYSVI